MFYSHDTYGLGHLRRTLLLARFLRKRRRLTQLIVTGSSLAHRFPLPSEADYIKLPSVRKVAAGQYESRFLGLSFQSVRELRRDLLLDAARHFRPRVLIVDNVPRGLKGELIPTLGFLKSISAQLVLGLRDVVDEPAWVQRAWEEDGTYDLLERLYDRILVYGEREIYDAVAAYRFPPAAADKTRYVGYLRRERPQTAPSEIRTLLGVGPKRLVLIMAGGGEDGHALLRVVLEALSIRGNRSDFETVLLGGPLMPNEHREDVLARVRDRSIRYVDFVEDVASYVDAADVVVSMGGYNSVCELLSLRKPALIVPRVTPRREQLIRARALSRLGLLRMLEPSELEPGRLLEEMNELLESGSPRASLPMDGLHTTADVVDELLAGDPVGSAYAAVGV
jgi:predicted glycosyltransferase